MVRRWWETVIGDPQFERHRLIHGRVSLRRDAGWSLGWLSVRCEPHDGRSHLLQEWDVQHHPAITHRGHKAMLINGQAGFAIFHGALVAILLAAVMPPKMARFLTVVAFLVVSVGANAAVWKYAESEHLKIPVNATGVAYLTSELGRLGIETWPTDANYILAKTGEEIVDGLLAKGVIVRPMAGFGLTEHVRISIGLPEENERLVKAISEIRSAGGSDS